MPSGAAPAPPPCQPLTAAALRHWPWRRCLAALMAAGLTCTPTLASAATTLSLCTSPMSTRRAAACTLHAVHAARRGAGAAGWTGCCRLPQAMAPLPAAACCRLLPPAAFAAFAAAACRHQTDSDPVLRWQLQEEPPKPNNTAVWLLRNPQAHMFVRMFKVGAWV